LKYNQNLQQSLAYFKSLKEIRKNNCLG